MPKYASQVVTRFIKPLSQPYNDLANAFTSNNSAELNAILNKHREVSNCCILKILNELNRIIE